MTGRASAVVSGETIRTISVRATGVEPTGVAHAMHIHYGDDARNECRTLRRDDTDEMSETNRIGLLNTVEGLPAYGPIVVSFTTTGDTSPESALALDRFPAATEPKGKIRYHRTASSSRSSLVPATRARTARAPAPPSRSRRPLPTVRASS